VSCTSLNSYDRWKPSASQQVTIVPHSQEWRCNTDKRLSVSPTSTCVIIDGIALVQALAKPKEAKTFGEYSDALYSIQEEADTRMVLHACEAKTKGVQKNRCHKQ